MLVLKIFPFSFSLLSLFGFSLLALALASVPDFMLHLAHVTMPFAHPGSAITTVIRQLVRVHPGLSTVVLSHNRDVSIEGADNLLVDFTQFAPKEYFSPTEMMRDHAMGALGLQRPAMGRLQLPAMKALQEKKPDVIFVHEGHYACSSLPAWRRHFPDTKLFLYVHTHIARSYLRPELVRLLSPLDGIICVSDYIANHIRERAGAASQKMNIQTVLNGVDCDKFTPPITPPPAREVLFIGQIGEHKGVDLGVAALPLLRHPIHLRVVGSSIHGTTSDLSPFEQELREAAKKAEASGSTVSFEPYKPNDEVPSLYREAGIVLVPSRFGDPCPLVVLESLASGAAIVASDRGGIPSEVADAGLVVNPTPQNLADALDTVLGDETRYLDLRNRARERALGLTWDHQYKELMRVVTST